MRRRPRLADGPGRHLGALAAVVAVPLAGWLTLRFGPQAGIAMLAVGGIALCLVAPRRER